MRLIDADALIEEAETVLDEHKTMWFDAVSVSNIRSAPSIDIVRCQDCKYWVYNFNGCSRNPCTEPWYATDFCNYGEREDE